MADNLAAKVPGPDSDALESRLFAKGAGGLNTARAYTADWNHFLAWCRKRNRSPLPADPDQVASYLRHCAEDLKLSTVLRRSSAISEIHKRKGFQTPTDEWVVRSTIRRLRQEHGSAAGSKKPLLVEDIKKMISHCPTTLAGKRDKALLLIGFAGALKRSELVNLDFEDVSVAKEGIVLTIYEKNSEKHRELRKVAIPYGRFRSTCPVTALLDWLDEANISTGPLLRSFNKHGRPKAFRMSDRVVAEVVKKYSELIGKRAKSFSAHSLRAGFATAAAIAGAAEASIQKQTGHKSLMVLRRYTMEASLFRENAAAKLEF